jgi:hypothetical protein
MKRERKFQKYRIRIFFIVVSIIIICSAAIFLLRLTGYGIKQEGINLYFYDEKTNCSLNGYLFINDILAGKTENGSFYLSYEDYTKNAELSNESNIFLLGKLGECFKDKKEMIFDKYWTMPNINKEYFFGDSNYIFKTEINIHNPKNIEVISFIRPEKVRPYLKEISLDNNPEEDLSKINSYLSGRINYNNDTKILNWQLPQETLEAGKGICNDYSTALLSMFLAYNPAFKCYNIILSDHVTTLCNFGKDYIYYDELSTEVKSTIDDSLNSTEFKSRLLSLNRLYFNEYGLNETEKADIAFNDKEYVEFKSDEEFIDWQYSLKDKNTRMNILFDLEKKYNSQISEKKYDENISELYTKKPERVSSAIEIPTISGFFSDYFYLIFISFILIAVLLVILYKVNKKYDLKTTPQNSKII